MLAVLSHALLRVQGDATNNESKQPNILVSELRILYIVTATASCFGYLACELLPTRV
jgi:hypothetical protein